MGVGPWGGCGICHPMTTLCLFALFLLPSSLVGCSSAFIGRPGRNGCCHSKIIRRRKTSSPSSRLRGWSVQADFRHPRDKNRDDRVISDDNNLYLNIQGCEKVQMTTMSGEAQTDNRTYDLSSPREWLEFQPDGVYTVMRCDYYPPTTATPDKDNVKDNNNNNNNNCSGDATMGGWKVWGIDFHLNRLQLSYERFENGKVFNQEEKYPPMRKTELLLEGLLSTAEEELLRTDNSNTNNKSKREPHFFVAMVTFLWHPIQSLPGRIKVKSHIFTNRNRFALFDDYNPNQLRASVALSQTVGPKQKLPSRQHHNPEAKLSSWCSRRRPLEDLFKPSHMIDEVILADESKRADGSASTTLLEGLTSNLFVLFPGAVLRTPPLTAGILGGYARELVIKHATKLGLKVEEAPISLEESTLWEEVFVTSSVKLVVPVGSVLVPDANDFQALWTTDPKRSSGSLENSVWKKIYNGIVEAETKQWRQS